MISFTRTKKEKILFLVEKNYFKIKWSLHDFIIPKNVKLLYNICDILLIKKMWFYISVIIHLRSAVG